ncbi:hypothetical protein OAJ61_00380 [bacterium]|nr:hypothetical protein [bacterium]
MKKLHRPDLLGWSVFNEERNIDFHGTLLVNPAGNVLIDPLPLNEHDENHLDSLGGAAHIIITNSDHVRDAARILLFTGAKSWGPLGEKGKFPLDCDGWLQNGDKPTSNIEVFCMEGSKTPGELAILIDENTLVTGDLIRANEGGKLSMLPEEKLQDRELALNSIKRLAAIKSIEAVIPGDGWPIFKNGHDALTELAVNL